MCSAIWALSQVSHLVQNRRGSNRASGGRTPALRTCHRPLGSDVSYITLGKGDDTPGTRDASHKMPWKRALACCRQLMLVRRMIVRPMPTSLLTRPQRATRRFFNM
jgi:hypothetical protein